MRVVFGISARAELLEATRWYEAISPELAQEFGRAIDRAVTRIAQAPLMWTPLTKRIRRCLVDQFPYALIYRAGNDSVEVLAVMHQRRRPGYWRGR
jgi:plasmid stabilization system protein ParE